MVTGCVVAPPAVAAPAAITDPVGDVINRETLLRSLRQMRGGEGDKS